MECALDICPGGGDQLESCRVRAAWHETGHALVLCRVYASEAARDKLLFGSLLVDLGSWAARGFPLPEAWESDAWKDALIQLGGVAAESIVFGGWGSRPLELTEDGARARRLLRALSLDGHLTDALSITRELLDHHRPALEAIAPVLLSRGAVTGFQVWDLFRKHSG